MPQIDRGSNRSVPRSDDVVVLMKKHICDVELSQRPLLALTKTVADRMTDLPVGKHALRDVAQSVRRDWLKLAQQVLAYYGASYTSAANYLRQLEAGDFHRLSEPCQLPWLTARNDRVAPQPVLKLHKCILDALAPAAPLRAVWARR